MESKQEPQFYYATEDTYAIAAELSEQGFEEKDSLLLYDECNSLFISPKEDYFEFTSNDIIEFTKKETNMEKINLKTVEQWQTK